MTDKELFKIKEIQDKKYLLKHRPIAPEIHDKESREWFKVPPCTCYRCNDVGDNPLNCHVDGSY